MLMYVLVLINKHEGNFGMYLVGVDYACLFVCIWVYFVFMLT